MSVKLSALTGLLVAMLGACTFDGAGLGPTELGEDVADANVAAADARPTDATTADAGAPDAEPPPSCPDSYERDEEADSAYRVSLLALDWYTAEAACEADGVGAHLVVIDNDFELDHVLDRVGTTTVWVGMSDSVDEGEFVWVNGVDAWFQPWDAHEPNDNGLFGEDCTQLLHDAYNDTGCGELHRYVCECDGVPADHDAWQ